MAEKRMLSRVISVSEKVNSLPDIFDMLLFTWMIPHTDDYGRLTGSPAKIKALVVPMLDKTKADIDSSLHRLQSHGVIDWYEADGEKVIQIINFEKHQDGLKTKRASKYQSNNSHLTSSTSYLSASEREVEELIVESLRNNDFIENEDVISVERQLRIDNSYLDILATGISARYLFEVKRQRLSNSSIEQIIKYRSMLGDDDVRCTLIGNGLASNFNMKRCSEEKINVLVYDDLLAVESKLLINVKYRQPMLLSNRTELNRTELKGIEKNRTEDEQIFGVGVSFNPYRVFEQEGFGTISPVLKDQIDDLVSTYGDRWYQEAMKTAVVSGKRSLAYVNGILKRWKTEGIDEPWKEDKHNADHQGSYEGVRSGRNSKQSEYAFLDQQNRTGSG